MELVLNDVELRVLGSLIEKELATPEYYPLTMNGLKAACNQKSSRNPVMSLDESDIADALASLRSKHLAWEHRQEGARVLKYSHNLPGLAPFAPQETALLGVLMLRGPQTPGEIRSHVGRMCAFRSLEEVEETLRTINAREQGPFVTELPCQPGRKEIRYAHLLAGEPTLPPVTEAPAAAQPAAAPSGTLAARVEDLARRVAALEERVESLSRGVG